MAQPEREFFDNLLFEAVLIESLDRRARDSGGLVTGKAHHRAAWAALAAVIVLGFAAVVLEWPARRYPKPSVEGDYIAAGARGTAAEPMRGRAILAGPGGARVRMGGYCDLALSPRTEVVLRGGKRAEAVELVQGTLHARVKSRRGKFTVWTPLGNLSVVGTEFVASVEQDGAALETGEEKMRDPFGRSSLVTVLVLSGIVGYSFNGESGMLHVGESKLFAAEAPAFAAAAPAPAPAATAPATALFHPQGRFHMLDMYHQPAVLADAQGLFMLARGVLGRYDPNTLALVKSVELLGPAPEVPKDGFNDYAQANQYALDAALRTLPATMTATDTDLLILIAGADRYIRVDKATLTVKVNKSVKPAAEAAAAAARPKPLDAMSQLAGLQVHWEPVPVPAVQGSTLYFARRNDWTAEVTVMAVDIGSGTAVASTDLPPQMLPRQWKPIKEASPFKNLYMVAQRPAIPLTATPQGLFVYQCGVVAQFDAATMEFKGMAELFGPLPNPDDAAPKEEKAQATADRARRLLPAAVVPHGKDLLIVVGDRFFRVNTARCEVAATGSAEQADAAKAVARLDQLMTLGAPIVTLAEQSLCATHGRDAVLFNVADGKLLARKQLPVEMTRKLMNFPLPQPPPPEPVEGQPLGLRGIIEQHAAPAGDFWTLRDESLKADFVVTGEAFDKLRAGEPLHAGAPPRPDRPAEEPVALILQGVYHAKLPGVPAFGKGVVEVNEGFAWPYVNVTGRLVKHADAKGTFWTLKAEARMEAPQPVLLSGEFVLVGAKIAALAATPGIEKTQATISGKLTKQYPGAAAFGKGFIEVTGFNVIDEAEQN